jgi:hypothetical protein
MAVVGALAVLALSLGAHVYRSRMSKPSISIFPTAPGTRWVYEWPADFQAGVYTEAQTLELLKVSRNGTSMLAIKQTEAYGTPHYRYYDVGKGSATLVGSSWGEAPLENYAEVMSPESSPRRISLGTMWRKGSSELRAVGWASVATKAGTFPKALVVEVTDQGKYVRTEYYADGIGLVKQDMGQTLELVEFTPGK